MPEPPPRKFFVFQIHLSTAIVMMFVAGGLMWANVTQRQLFPAEYNHDCYGWPFVAVRIMSGGNIGFSSDPGREYWEWVGKNHYDLVYAAIDLATAGGLIFAVWFLCEYLIRRRAARK